MRSLILRSPVLRRLAQKGHLNPDNGRLIQRQPQRERVPFQYVSLCKEPQQIRLARASRRRVDGCAFISEDAVLNLELHNVSLSNPPSYIALSYTWGDANDTLDITCNDQFLHVTRTLAQTVYTVLCAVAASSTPLYDEGEDVWFWIDGLCINQEDVEEKNTQVRLMADIYSKARGVLAYIGAPKATRDPYAGFLATAALAGLGSEFKSLEKESGFDSAAGIVPDTAPRDYRDLWEHQWFIRSWITQEVTLSQVVICLYGAARNIFSFSLETLWTLVHEAMGMGGLPYSCKDMDFALPSDIASHVPQVDVWRTLKYERETKGSINLVIALSKTRVTKSKDPRDKVFSILGLLSEEDRNAIHVDYSPLYTPQKTFKQAAQYYIGTKDAMALLEHAGTQKSYSDLPSWVPDWSTEGRCPLTSDLYRCGGSTAPSVTLREDGNTITVRGVLLDWILVLQLSVGSSYSDGKPEEDEADIGTVLFIEQQARHICEGLYSSRDRFPNAQEPGEVVWRLMTVDRAWEHRRMRPEDKHLYEAFLSYYSTSREQPTAAIFTGEGPPEQHFEARTFAMAAYQYREDRVFGATTSGYVGVLPDDTRRGDSVAVFLGSNLPFVLRADGNGMYELVGPCYIHGIMDGELFDSQAGESKVKPEFIKDLVIR